MIAQIVPLQAGFTAATTRHRLSLRLRQLPARWVARFFAVCATLAFDAPSAFAQVYQWTNFAGMPGGLGNVDGTGSAARFNNPSSVAVDSNGNIYVADQYSTIRKVTPGGVVTTLAGLMGSTGSSDGTGSAARFNHPSGVAVDSSGNVYVADTYNSTIRKVTPEGVVTTLAGQPGRLGGSDGTGSAARFGQPYGIAVDGSGNVYVADDYNATIRKVTPGGAVTTLAGLAGSQGSIDGTGSAARFGILRGLAMDSSGNIYVADLEYSTIRKVTPGGVVSTLAGLAGSQGSSDGTGSAARFWNPMGVAVDGGGNVYVADHDNQTLRKVTPAGVVSTLAGQQGTSGSSDGAGSVAGFCYPEGVAVDGSGNVYVADTGNHTIRKMTLGGVVSTIAGLASNRGSSDGGGSAARFNTPTGVAVDGSGNVYVADLWNGLIRKVTPGGVVSTLAGRGSDTQLSLPASIAADGSGNVYVADQGNNTIHKVTPGGVVTTLAGLAGSSGSSDGMGSAARFNSPVGIAVDGSGNVYVAEQYNNTIRKVTPDGLVSTLAGQAGSAGSSDGTGSAAQFNFPCGLAVDNSGNLYVADAFNCSIRRVTPAGVVTTLAGGSLGSNDGTGSAAQFNFPAGVAVDGRGNVYVSDNLNHTIRKVTAAGVVTTIGGTPGVISGTDGTGAVALFSSPAGIAVTSTGILYVADSNNNRISMGVTDNAPVVPSPATAPASYVTLTGATLNGTVNANGLGTTVTFDYGLTNAYGTTVSATPASVTGSSATSVSAVISGLSRETTFHFRVNVTYSDGTVSGGDLTFTTGAVAGQYAWTNFAGMPGGVGSADGTVSTARFNLPTSVAVDGSGNIYVAESINSTIRKITPGGVVSTLAGLAENIGSSDGAGGAARFNHPSGVAVDGSGNVYVADRFNNTIRKITPSGVVTTLAGLAGNQGSSDGAGSAARFSSPAGVAVDGNGNIYVTDYYNHTLRKVTPAGVVSTLAGQAGSAGSSDGTGSAARFIYPTGVAVDASQNIYVVEAVNNAIRKVTAAGVVSTLAGGVLGSDDGTGSGARFNNPSAVTVDGSGNLYVADQSNSTLRKVTPGGVVTTLAGLAGNQGHSDGTGSAAQFNGPAGVAMGSDGNIIVADTYNNTLRKVTPDGVVSTLTGQVGFTGSTDGTGSAARFWNPTGLAVDGGGDVYVADTTNNTLRKITPGGVVSTLAGQARVWGSSDGTGSAAEFINPAGVAVDNGGNIYVADQYNNTIRKVTPGGVVSTLAGVAWFPGSSDGTGSEARFSYPTGVTVDGSGNVYVADQGNNAVRKITPAGVVSTLVGGPSAYVFNNPSGVAVDSGGNVYVADTGYHAIRKVTPGGVVSTLAGQVDYQGGSSDGTGSAARFNNPEGLAIDARGNLYVADTGNHTIRKVTPAGVVTTLGGTAGVADGVDGLGAAARFSYPTGIAVSSSGTLYVADAGNNRISVGVFAPAPSSYTAAAGAISGTGATLNGMVNANGLSTTVTFDYGPTTAYGTSVSATPAAVTAGSDTNVSAVISGLSPGTTYHFRVSGANTAGITYGSDQTFTTAAATPTSWRQQWYSTTSNSGTAADNADPYHTGVPNLVVFALFGPNQNPAQVAASQLPQPQMVGGNFGYSFTEPAGVSNVTYGAQYTTTLSPANWQPVTDTGSGTQHVFVVPIGSNPKMFLRLTLTNLNP